MERLFAAAVDGLRTVVTLAALLVSVAVLSRGATFLVDAFGADWVAHGTTGHLLFAVAFVVAFAFVFGTWRAFYDGVEDGTPAE
jgi:uncharacterized membrane protein YcjF (UPF0283 family)